jgi:hypothetical protein
VEKNCQTCHAATPKFGAPMALVTAADFLKPSPSNAAMTVAQSVKLRINATDNKRMPPASSTALSPADLGALNKWLDAGAAAGPAGAVCAPAGQPGAVEGGTAMVPSSKAADDAAIKADPSVTCYTFTAHGSTKEEPYKVGLATDAYFNFSFNAPWKGTQYAKAFRAKTDNMQVIHHWLLFKEPAMGTDGAVSPSSGAHPGSELVQGWAPGGEDLIMNSEVGIELPSTGFTLETHYNSKDAAAMDRSGVEICVTPNKPKNIAGVAWVGTDAINGTSATGMCAPDTGQMIRILGGTPHMHTAGTHMKVEILRADGKNEILHDAPFDFNYQRAYDYQAKELWLKPGDKMRTTCTYNRPVTFGEGTGDEMCYFFTLHYPMNALSQSGLGQAIHGPNSCGVL